MPFDGMTVHATVNELNTLLSDGRIGYCAILSGLGVICGHGGYLRPQDALTRAEAIIMLYRYLLTI